MADLSAELQAVKQQNETLMQEKTELSQDNAELKKENARLRGLIEACVKALPESAAHLQAKPPPKVELSPAEEAEKGRVKALVEGETTRGECSFFFVSADWILEQTSDSLPKFQDLRLIDGALVQKTLQAGKAYRSEYAQGELLAVSHRWEKPSEPDTAGKQLERIKAHLRANRHIKFVWYDYWCMPQGDRSPADLVHFVWMLKNVNLLYLGCSVLILLDISYLSRFWTQMEAWLSMQLGSTDGLRPAPESMRRCSIDYLHTATSTTRTDLINMWASRTPEEAHALLSQPDVQVTNQSDKVQQLEKVRGLDPRVREEHSSTVAREFHSVGESWLKLLGRGFSVDALQEANVVFPHEDMSALVSKFDLRELCGSAQTSWDWRGKDVTAAEAGGLRTIWMSNDAVEVNLDGFALPIKKLTGAEQVESLDLSKKDLKVASAALIGVLIRANEVLTSLKCAAAHPCSLPQCQHPLTRLIDFCLQFGL